MSDAQRTKRRRLPRFVPLVFMVVAIVATVPEDHHESTLLIVVRHAALFLTYGAMLVLETRKTELERLIFYKATVIAFGAALSLALGYSVLIDLDVVRNASLEFIAQFTVLIWLGASTILQRQAA